MYLIGDYLREINALNRAHEVRRRDLVDVLHLCGNHAIEQASRRGRAVTFDFYAGARMQALAPNLTTLVGELVGARLVQHAGSIMNLAKQPASICVKIKLSG